MAAVRPGAPHGYNHDANAAVALCTLTLRDYPVLFGFNAWRHKSNA